MFDDMKPSNGEEALRKEDWLFRIREFLDLRRIRESCGGTGEKPCVMDLVDGVALSEEDFGLRRSTPDEGWLFYLESLDDGKGEDELTEFLDDR